MSLNFVPSSRGDRVLLVLGNHTYYKFRTSVHFVTWRCTVRGCTATAFIADGEPPKEWSAHDHDANAEKLARKKVNEACKRRATEDLSEIMRTVLSENIPLAFTNNDKERVRWNMYNARQQVRPFKLPRSTAMVHAILNEMTVITSKDEQFLLVSVANCTAKAGFVQFSGHKTAVRPRPQPYA